MAGSGLLTTEDIDADEALEMHGYMLDFKKAWSFIANGLRVFFGRKAPRFGIRPERIPPSRILAELVVSGLFLVARTRAARRVVDIERLRVAWTSASKPTKRRDVADLRMVAAPNR
jgi:coenzyme F420 hydrogenase subunit beta